MMLKRTLMAGLATLGTLAFTASAQAAYLSLGTTNTSNGTTTLTGGPAAPELKVQNTNGSSAAAYGLYGLLTATSPTATAPAVRGHSSSSNANGIGVWGSQNGSGTGVYGYTPSGRGVYGVSSYGTGVRGVSTSGQGGVVGTGGTNGVAGFNTSGQAIFGQSGANNWAGYFQGNVAVSGTLYKGSGAFRIDDPLDPAHYYLQHSFVESPDMKDVYDGVVVTDRHGFATIKMPRWFQALNRSFRYQLTIVGRSFAQAIVWKPIAHNRFTIRTNHAHVRVSWQVTGIRHDRYANARRIRVVLPKPKADQGKYLHPELFGKPRSQGIGYQKPPRPPRATMHKH
jgi:hypothetical protein